MGEETSQWQRFFLSQQLTSVRASTATFLQNIAPVFDPIKRRLWRHMAIVTFVGGGRGA